MGVPRGGRPPGDQGWVFRPKVTVVPLYVAETLSLPRESTELNTNCALAAPSGKVTLAGAVSPLPAEIATTAPAGGGSVIETVQTVDCPVYNVETRQLRSDSTG